MKRGKSTKFTLTFLEKTKYFKDNMKLRLRYRIYPTDSQKVELAKLFGCCRVVWNDTLAFCHEQRQKGEKKPSYNELSKRLTHLKKTEEKIWLTEVSSVPLQQSLKDLEQSYSNFFNSCKGKRKGKKVKPPKFKKRKSRQAARFMNNGFKLLNNILKLPKIGDLKVIWSRPLPSEPTSVTIIKDSADRYFSSFVIETNILPLPENNNSIGIDLGITDFATLSNCEKIKSPKPLKSNLKRLRKLQRNLSRKEKGSKRRDVARKKVAKLHGKITDIRTDFLHKLSTKLIRENQRIALEDLNVSGMVKNRRLSRAISAKCATGKLPRGHFRDLGWRSFRTMLIAKGEMYGRDVRVIDRWEPTSQVCSCCGEKGGKKELSVREWTCLFCNSIHDRDVNASKNILKVSQCGHGGFPTKHLAVAEGHSDTKNGRGGGRSAIRSVEISRNT